MGDVTNGCHGIHGGVEVGQNLAIIEGLLLQVEDIRKNADNILYHLKIVVRDATGYLDESTIPRIDNPDFVGRVRGILNGVKEVLQDKTA